jgi:hypothetical protein
MTTVIQMKLMKAIRKKKNNVIQQFQLDMESQLIEVSIARMPSIQLVSMMMAIQMKLTKITCNLQNMMIQEFQLDMEL